MTTTAGVQTIRVAAYNLHGLRDDRAALLRVVRSIDADVLCVQEAPRHPGSGHRVARLAAQVGLTWADGRRGRMSTTVLTGLRVDLLDCRHVSLPVRRFDEPRGYAVATVALPGHRPLDVVSVHLSLRTGERGPHARDILGALGRSPRPVALAGDLNEEPGATAWRTFGAALQDVGGQAATFPSHAPDRRIDAIFAAPGLPASVPPPPWDPLDVARASDHLPLVVDLDLSALSATASDCGP